MADALQEAQRTYNEALDASRDQRRQIEEDLRFSDPSNPDQWDSTIKAQRESDPGGVRPCLVFDQTGQYISNVAGQVTKAPPSLHALPSADGADQKVAEQLDGLFRHIEHTSRAQQHYERSLLSSARCGVGYLVLRPEYVNRALNWQEPRISSEGDPLRVVLDPWSQELDGSDANFGYILTPLSFSEFERKYGEKAEKVNFGDTQRSVVKDDRQSVLVGEEWKIEDETKNMIVCLDPRGLETAYGEDEYHAASQAAGRRLQVLRTYKDKVRTVRWSQMSGAAYLSEETTYPADGIGIVPVYGYYGFSEGRMRYCGIARRAMNPQRSYNYHMSEMHAFMGQAPKAPWIASIRAVKGLEAIWDRATVDARAYLPFNDVDETGHPIDKPDRTPLATNLQNHIQGAEQALRDIQSALGMYQANLGAPSNETSGVAIDNRKEQGEASTSHFPSNLSASLGQIGKLTMQMIPRLYDQKRQVRILGIDQTPSTVTIDPKQEGAVTEQEQGGLVINPNVGEYDVRVVVGASFSTQRSQAQEAFTEMMRANPALTPAIAPLWAQTLDIPHADKLAQVLTAVAPPAVKQILQPESDKGPTTAELAAKVDQLQQALQEALKHAHDAQADADEANSKLEDKSAEVDVAFYNAETNRLKVTGANEEQIQAIVAQMVVDMLSSKDPLPGDAPLPAPDPTQPIQPPQPPPQDPSQPEPEPA